MRPNRPLMQTDTLHCLQHPRSASSAVWSSQPQSLLHEFGYARVIPNSVSARQPP